MTDRPSGHAVPEGMLGGDEPAPPAVAGPPPAEPTHAERARTLVAGASRGALSTVAVEPAGYPFGSVATYALDDLGNPLFFVSRMAEHTQNAGHDPRASLLVAEPVPEGTDPLAAGRVTLLGDMAEVGGDDRPTVRDRYLAANPSSAYYIDFGDFVFFRLTVGAVRYVGGYGRMSWVDAAAYAAAEADPLAGAPAAAIAEHMDADHREAMVLICRHVVGLADTTAAAMGGVDRYGFDVVATTPAGRQVVRVGFPAPVASGDEVRAAMVALVREARSRSTTSP